VQRSGDTALEKLVPMRGMRWPIETCFEDRQQRLGMDDDAGRSGPEGPHHRTLIMRRTVVWGAGACGEKKAPAVT